MDSSNYSKMGKWNDGDIFSSLDIIPSSLYTYTGRRNIMKRYNLSSHDTTVQFSYKGLPASFFMTLHVLGYMVQFTGNRIYPYQVMINESEFLSCIELSEA